MIAYLIREESMGFFNALYLCRQKRAIVCPNHGFAQELQKFEKDCLKQAKLLKETAKANETLPAPVLTDVKTEPEQLLPV